MPVALRWGKGGLSHQQQQQLQRERERDRLGAASVLAFNGSQWRVIEVKLHRVRCFNDVARARGEDGSLSRENAREEIRPRHCHGERRVRRANEGKFVLQPAIYLISTIS